MLRFYARKPPDGEAENTKVACIRFHMDTLIGARSIAWCCQVRRASKKNCISPFFLFRVSEAQVIRRTSGGLLGYAVCLD